MKRAGCLAILGLLGAIAAAGASPAGCSVQKGLYDEWLSLSKRGSNPRKVLKLLGGNNSTVPDAGREQQIVAQYDAFFQCLSDSAGKKDEKPFCEEAADDRLAAMACQLVQYVKDGRTGSKEFIDALPNGKKGAEMIWDLEAIAGGRQGPPAAVFGPKGPAYKLIDELFVLVLDDKEFAAAKYISIVGSASETGAHHIDEQMKVLLLESPAVVVKQWPVLRQSLPKIKALLAEMAKSLPPADLRRMRQGVAGFCTKDNLDCPEILKTFGRPD